MNKILILSLLVLLVAPITFAIMGDCDNNGILEMPDMMCMQNCLQKAVWINPECANFDFDCNQLIEAPDLDTFNMVFSRNIYGENCTDVQDKLMQDELSRNDFDGDGFYEDDCDYINASINPNATEILDNDVDENCDGIKEYTPIITEIDNDEDGFNSTVDCMDNDALVNPNATEICGNSFDENCDGITEECAIVRYSSGGGSSGGGSSNKVPREIKSSTEAILHDEPVAEIKIEEIPKEEPIQEPIKEKQPFNYTKFIIGLVVAIILAIVVCWYFTRRQDYVEEETTKK